MNHDTRGQLTSSHWGAYRVEVKDGRVAALHPFEEDLDPSPIGHAIVDVLDDPTRITAPMIRKSWLEGGPGTAGDKRGRDSFVEVSWEEASRLVATELERVRRDHGNQAIFAGSYGWASAGRFHHAPSQLKRFLNCVGGFTASVNTYSYAAAEVVVPHVLGNYTGHMDQTTGWDSIAGNCELFVAFGGLPIKNSQVSSGGIGVHIQRAGIDGAYSAGTRFVNVSPLRSDVMEAVEAEWLALRPNTDVALMLGLMHVLLSEGLHDRAFLDRYTTGFDRFSAYLDGSADGVAKTADWAAGICDLPADTIRDLARRMAAKRMMIAISWSLTRQDHGEQPYWAAITLAAMLGQIGQPGTGVGFGYSNVNAVGMSRRKLHFAAMPQGQNPVSDFIPVARITDLLEKPGETFDYNGKTYTYPDIKIVWWAGGNPFHHQQNLNRLRRAWARPETVIVNEWCWTATARHADIVLPCNTTLERSDIALTPKERYQVAMRQAVEPVGQGKSDHDILRGIAAIMGVEQTFTEDRSPEEWQRWIYDISRQSAARERVEMPSWETFQAEGWFKIPPPDEPTVMMRAFRENPEANPLATPSGKIEIFSETVAGFGYDDCPGHAAWIEPLEWLGGEGRYPLHLLSNQPRNKLHSQLDHGALSRGDRIQDREPVTMHPDDAASRSLTEGQVVRIFNDRGACLAGLRISDEVRPGAIQIATGAWFDPDGTTCRNGNPNVLTPDKGTSRLAQGPIANTCMVEVVGEDGVIPEVRAYRRPN